MVAAATSCASYDQRPSSRSIGGRARVDSGHKVEVLLEDRVGDLRGDGEGTSPKRQLEVGLLPRCTLC
eukprot:COSAG06_NODE_142_length_22286_cov_5.328751_7_plen_68_part_00